MSNYFRLVYYCTGPNFAFQKGLVAKGYQLNDTTKTLEDSKTFSILQQNNNGLLSAVNKF